MKRIKRIIYILLTVIALISALVLLFNLGVIGGLNEKLPVLQYAASLPVGEEIPCGKKTGEEFELVAENSSLKLYLRPVDGNFYVQTATGECWYANPPDGSDSWARGVYKTEMISSLIINYIDLEENETVKKNSQAASVKKDTFTLRKLDNGFRADYYFKDGAVTIPVEVTLADSYLDVRILTGEIIEENPERYLLSSIRLLPNFGGCGEGDEGYIFVPDGQGALMYNGNGKGSMLEYKAAVYGDNASTTRMFSPAQAYSASLPVFGIKRNDAAFLAVITAGENAASLVAMPSFRDTSYANVWAEYKLRFTDSYMLDETSNLAQTITLYQDEAIEVSACQQRYYFLDGEAADYNGMAACYRDYLLSEGGLTEKQPDDTLLFVDTYAAVTRDDSILGVPVKKQHQLSSLTDVYALYEDLRTATDGSIRLRVNSWSRDALKGKLDTKLTWAAGNNWQDWSALQSAAEAQGDTVSLAVELLRYEKSGSGIVPIRDSALSLSGSPAFQYEFTTGTRMRDKENRGYLLHPVLLEGIATKVLNVLSGQEVHSLSPLTLGDTRYGSYGKNAAYPEQTQQAICAALAAMDGYDLVLEQPNAFALPYADYVTDIPGGSSQYDVLDAEVPFLQMVYGDLVGYAGEAINLSADPDSAVLHAIATGEALHYALITGDAELLIDTELNTLFSARTALWLPRMKAAAAQIAQSREWTENSRLVSFVWLDDGVSLSTFQNGAELCVNGSHSTYVWHGTEIPAGEWRARKEAAE